MPILPYDGIHHIDMHMKLLDEETLLIGQYPQGVSDGPQIEANMLYVLDNHNSTFDSPYKIVRVIQPPDDLNRYPSQNGDYRTYSNAVFINKTVLLPLYEERYDTTALRVWRESLPGYRVIGLDCNDIIAASGAIHCITHSVGVNDPLLITHQALHNTYDTQNAYQVSAFIQHRSGIQQAKVYYTIDTTQAYNELPMTLVNSAINQWETSIPPQQAGSTIYYYIQALSESGKIQVRPIVAPEGWWKFQVLDSSQVSSFQNVLLDELFHVEAFPNPSKGITCIPVNSSISLTYTLSILNAQGQLITRFDKADKKSGEKREYVNTQTWESGVYFIRVETKYGSRIQKLIVR
jgi:hypothetical protein